VEEPDQGVKRQPGVDHVLDEQHVAATDVSVEILEQPHAARAAGTPAVVAGELDEVDAMHDRGGPREVGQEHEARLERADEERLPPGVVLGDLRAELGDACADLLRREVDLADPVVGVEFPLERGQEARLSPYRWARRSMSRL
jgi:hypothetical protein